MAAKSLIGATANTADFLGGGSTPLASASGVAPTTAAQKAEALLKNLRSQRDTLVHKKAAPALIKSVELQIEAVLKQHPTIAKREQVEATRVQQQIKDANAKHYAKVAQDARDGQAWHAHLMGPECGGSFTLRGLKCPGNAHAEYQSRHKFISSAGVDWGLIPMGAKVLGTGAAAIATGGLAAGALAGGLSLASGATALAAGASTVKGAASLVTGKPKTSLPVPSVKQVASLAVPGLASAAKSSDLVMGTKAAADKLVAAAGAGGVVAEKAGEVYAATKTLAEAGNLDAAKAIEILHGVATDRVKSRLSEAQEQQLSPRGELALEKFADAIKLAAPVVATSSPATSSPAPATSSVRGLLVLLETGRLDFSSPAWRSVAAGTKGAKFGIVVDDGGRIAFDQHWVAA